jgi:hypothetical protein
MLTPATPPKGGHALLNMYSKNSSINIYSLWWNRLKMLDDYSAFNYSVQSAMIILPDIFTMYCMVKVMSEFAQSFVIITPEICHCPVSTAPRVW